jgi:hypothetical protein
MNVSCRFSGVYFEPTLRLSLGSVQLVEDGRQTHSDHHGYTVAVWKLFTMQDMARGHARLGCRMRLPGTGYEVSLQGGEVRYRREEEEGCCKKEEDSEV